MVLFYNKIGGKMKKLKNKKIIIILVLVLLCAIGGAAYYVLQDKEPEIVDKTNRNFINDIEIITDKNTDEYILSPFHLLCSSKQLPVMKILEEELDESEYEHGRCNNILILKASYYFYNCIYFTNM